MADKRKGSVVKHSPNNSWFRNAVRSMGLAGSELIKDMVPAMYETGSSLYNTSKEAKAAMRSTSTKNLSKTIANMIEQNQYTRMARNSVTNAISDLRTGNLYNKERMDKAMEADLGLEDFNLDDILDGSDDVDFGDISDESIDVNVNNTNVVAQNPEASRVLIETVDEGMRQAASATLTAAKAQTDTTIAVASNAIAAMQSTGDAIVRKLDSIDSNISSLVTYLNDNVTKFIEASSKYYETMISGSGGSDDSVKEEPSPFSDHGGFNIKGLIQFAQNNAIKMAQESTVGSMAQMLTISPALIENGLIPALMKGGMKALIPKVLQNSLTNTEKIFQGFAETLLTRLADFSTSSNPFIAAAGKIFGYREKAKTSYDLTKVERGAIPFDGMTKHSIVEIIPRELRKIQEILTGKEAKIYDWSTGQYASPEEIRKNNRNMVRQEGISAMENSEFGNKMKERSLLLNEEDQKKFSKMLETFYDNLTKFEGFFDPNNESSITKMLPGMQQEFGKAMSDFFIKAVQTAGESAQMSINPAKNKGLRNRRRLMESMESNPYEYNLYATEMDTEPVPTLNLSRVETATAATAAEKTRRSWLSRLRGQQATPTAETTPEAQDASTVASTPRGASRSTRFRGQRTRRTRTNEGSTDDDGGPYLSRSVEEYSADELERRMRQQDEIGTSLSNINYNTGSRAKDLINGPATKVSDGVTAFGNMLYKFAFGNGQDVMNELLTKFGDMLTGLADKLDKNILQPIKNSLVGTTDQDGFSRGGVFSNVINSSKDFMNSVWSKFNGKSYKTSTGETVEGDPQSSVVGQLKRGVQTVKEETMNFLFGKKNKETGKREGGQGFLAKARDSLRDGLNKWGEALFGKQKNEDGTEIATEFTKQVKERAPKAFATGIAGAGVGLLNGMGTFGLLGSAFLPGGPIGGAIVGSALGFVTQSDRFKDWLFGKEDENGERTGGLISKKVQDFFKNNKTEIIGGAALGTMKSMILGGSGILTSIVGGPMAGALMGSAFALAKRSKVVQELLYGKGEPGDPDYKKGIINSFKEKMQTKDGKNRFGLIGTGAAGGAMAASIVGNMGVIGAALTPAGPIGGALMGAGMGIAMASDRFRELVFGKKNEETGKKEGGLVQKFQTYVSTELFQPAKLFLKGVALDAKEFFAEKMIEPLQRAMDPIVEEFKYIGSRIKDKVSEIANNVISGVKSIVLEPLGSALNKYLVDPLKKVGSTIFNAVFGVVKSIIGAPFKAIGAFAGALTGRQTSRAVKEKDDAIWNDPNLGFFGKIKESFKLNASSKRQKEAAEEKYPWMEGREEREAERAESRTVRKYADRYDYEKERMAAFDKRFEARAKGYDLSSDAGLEALSKSDRKKVEKEQARRQKEGARIDKLNVDRLRKGLPLLKNPYAKSGSFYDQKTEEAQKKWIAKENEKRKKKGQEPLNDPFAKTEEETTVKEGETSEATKENTTVKETSSNEESEEQKVKQEQSSKKEESTVKSETTKETSEESSEESTPKKASFTEEVMSKGGIQFFAGGKKKEKSSSETAEESGEKSTVVASNQSKSSSSTSTKGKEKDSLLRYVKDIRNEVNGQLNGLGSNVNKIKRMLAKALGVKDPDKDTGDGNKEYKSLSDRFFDFISRPIHNLTKLVTAPIRVVSGIVNSIKEKFTNAVNAVKELPSKLVGGVISIAKGIGSAVGGAINGVLSSGAKIIDGAFKGIGRLGSAVLSGFTGLVEGAARGIGSVISSVATVGEAIVNGAVTVVNSIPTLLSNTAEAIGNIINVGFDVVKGAFNTAKTAIIDAATVLKSAVVGTAKTIWHGIKGIASGIFGAVGSVAGFIGDKLGIKNKTKVRYAGEIQRITEPVTVITAEGKPIHVVIDKFDDKVGLEQESINELRGYDEDGEVVDSFEDFFGSDDESGTSSGGGFKKFLKSFMPKSAEPKSPAPAPEAAPEESEESKVAEAKPTETKKKPSLIDQMLASRGLQFFAQPKKQYGRQFDADEAAEDAEDAAILKEKVEENTKKDASYMMNLIKEADAAAEEKEMRQRMVEGIENIDIEQKSHNSIWDSIFSKKGLITAGLIALAPIILKFLNKFLDFDLSQFLSKMGNTVEDVVNNAVFGIENTDTAKEASEQKDEYTDLVTGQSTPGEFILPNGEHDATSDSRLKMFTKPVERGVHYAKEAIIKSEKIKQQGAKAAFSKTTMSDRMAAGQLLVKKAKGLGEDVALRAMYAGDAIKNFGQKMVAPGSVGEDIALKAMYAADTVKDKAGQVATKVANSRAGQAVSNAASTVATKASNAASTVKTGATKTATKVGEKASSVLTAAANTNVGKTVTTAASGIADTITKTFDNFVSFMEKKIPSVAGKLSKVVKPVAEAIIGDNSLLKKIAAKVSTKVASKGGLAAVTLGASEIVWAIVGAVDGATSASNMFVCEKDAVDWKMILISSAMKAALQTTIGTIFDIIDSILWATTGVSVVRSLAQIIYGVMASEEEVDALSASQQVVQQDYLEQVDQEKQKAYEEYVKGLEDPTAALSYEEWEAQYGDQVDVTSFADYNDERNKTMFHKVTDAVGGAVSKVKEGVSNIWSGVKNAASTVGSKVKDVASGAWNGIKGAASTVWGGVTNAASTAWEGIKGVGSTIGNKVTDIVETVGPVVSEVTRTFKNAGKKIANAIGEKISDVTEPIREKFGEFKDSFVEGWATVKEGASTLIGNAKDALGNAARTIWDNTEPIREAASEAVTKVKEGLSWVGSKFKEGADAVGDTAKMIWDNLGEVWDDVKEKVGDLADSVKNNFKKGLENLNNTFGTIFGFTDEDGNPVSFTDGIKKTAKTITTGISNTISNIGIGLSNLWTKFSNWANDENKPMKEYVGSGRGRGRVQSPGYRALGWGRGSDIFNQLDSRWNTADPSMRDSGCGPSVAAMMVRHYGRGKTPESNPIEASKMSYDLGMRDADGGMNPAFFEKYGATKGVDMTEGPISRDLISNSLANDRPVALMGQGGAFGTGMHYLMADGIRGTNVDVVDPYGGTRKSSSIDNLIRNSTSAVYSKLGRGDSETTSTGTTQTVNASASTTKTTASTPTSPVQKTTSAASTQPKGQTPLGTINTTASTTVTSSSVTQPKGQNGMVMTGVSMTGEPELKEFFKQKGFGRGPVRRWGRGTQNGIPYFAQYDSRWSSVSMAGGDIGSYGCVVCSFAMCMSAIAGKEITPPNVLSGYVSAFPGGLASWSNWPAAAQSVGGNAYAVKNRQEVLDALSKGHLVVVWARKTLMNGKVITNWNAPGGAKSSGQHAIVIVSGDGSKVRINDPANENRSSVDQDISTIPNSYTSLELEMWAFSGKDGAAITKGGTFAAASSTGTTDSTGTTATDTSSSTAASGNFFDKLSAGMTEIGNRLWEGALTGNYNTDFSTFFTSDSSSSSSGSTSSGSSGGVLNSGGEFPKYTDLTEDDKKFIAGVSSEEQDSSDISAQRLEVSQMANLSEVEYGREPTGANLRKTLTGGWYAQKSLNNAYSGNYSSEALQAVEEVLVQGKRTLPRHVTEHDYYGDITNIDLNPSTSTGKQNRRNMKQGDVIKNSMGSTYYFYKFAGKNGAEGYGDPFGSKPQYANQYQNDVPWNEGGSGRGRFGRGRGNASNRSPKPGTIQTMTVRGRGANPSTTYLEHAYRKAQFGRGVDDAYSNYAAQQAILNYLKIIASNTGSTVEAINGIEIPQSSSGIIVQGNSTNNNVTVKSPKTSGNSQATQKTSRNEAIARAIARGVT